MKYLQQFLSNTDWIELSLLFASIIAISIFVRLIEFALKQLGKKFPHKRMTVLGWVPLVNFTIYFSGFFTTFYLIMQPSREVLIGMIASGLLALGFAVKDLVASTVAGIVLLIDKPFQVGDRITFQGFYGDVIAIGLRSVKILTLDESIVTIPNHRFINDLVTSGSAGELGMMATVDVYVPPHINLNEVQEILIQAARANAWVNQQGKIVVVAQENLNMSGVVSVTMRVKCIIKDARKEKTFQTDLIMEINKEFKKHGVKQVTGLL